MSNSLPDRWVARLPQFCDEMHWAFGLVTLPAEKTPPPWVKALILRLFGNGEFRFLAGLNPIEHPNYTPAMLGQLTGGLKVMSSLLTEPDERILEEERQIPEIREHREKILKLKADLIAAIPNKKIVQVTPLPAVRTPEETADFLGGQHKGSKIAATRKSLADEPTFTRHISILLLLHWEEVRLARNIPDLYKWLMEAKVSKFSIKLLEKICHKVGLDPGASTEHAI